MVMMTATFAVTGSERKHYNDDEERLPTGVDGSEKGDSEAGRTGLR